MVLGLGSMAMLACLLAVPRQAHADDATVTVGPERFLEALPEPRQQAVPIAVDDADPRARRPDRPGDAEVKDLRASASSELIWRSRSDGGIGQL
jgi:hypothetical protein